MKSQFVNGTINKDIYVHTDASTEKEIKILKETVSEHTSEIQTLTDTKQDVLTAGENITIEDNVISATGGGSTGSFIVLDDNITIEAGQDVQIPVANELCQTPVLWSSVVVNDGTEEVELAPYFDSQTHTCVWHDDSVTIQVYAEEDTEGRVYMYSENGGDYHLLIKFDNTMPTYIDVLDDEAVSIRPIDVQVAIQFGKQIVGFIMDDSDQIVETGYITEIKQDDEGNYIIECLGQLYQAESLTSYFQPISKPDDTSSVTFWLTQSPPRSAKGMPADDYWYLEEGYNLQSIIDAWNNGEGDVYLAYKYNGFIYKYRVTTVNGLTKLAVVTTILAECVNNIDIDKNTVELKYIKAEGTPTQTGVEFRVITKTVNEIAQDSNTFVVFDGDLTFEEYFDPNNDVNIGRIVNPSEFDEIENGDARSASHCPLLYDYVEIDGESLVKSRNSPLWYSSDEESFVSIGNEDGIGEDVYLEIRANSAGIHHIKILASYGGTVYVGYGGASMTVYLNLTPRDVKIAYRTLKKAILAFQPLGGGPTTNYSTLSHFNELEDLNEEELYTIECGGFAYFAKYLRNFKSNSSWLTTRIDATIVSSFETSDTLPEDSTIYSSISPDQLISAITSGMMVNISFVRSYGDGTTTDIVPSIYYQITKDEIYGIYAIELQPPHYYSGAMPSGITTNTLFDKSNEWYYTINPLK